MKKTDQNIYLESLTEAELSEVTGAFSEKPRNVGGEVDQYQVRAGYDYYYHYKGGGHDQWLIIRVLDVYEKRKILWFTERFARVLYESGAIGELPLDTHQVFYIL